MTRDETKKIIAVIIASYPNYKPNDMAMTVEVWATMLQDYDYKEMGVALQSFIATDTDGFAPSIGQLIDKYHTMSSPIERSENEVWALVRNAISDSTYHSEERFNELPILAQRCIGNPSQLRVWATDPGYNDNVVQSNFLKSYREMVNRAKEYQKLPHKVRDFIEANNNKLIEAKEIKDGI